MNRIDELFIKKEKQILSVYFTAGYPYMDSTVEILKGLVLAGADMIEIGVPFSVPMADGSIIQNSNKIALKNGMNLKLLFQKLRGIRETIETPLIIMSYYNPVLSFGMGNFCKSCDETGIDGVIIPDLPPEIFLKEFKSLFKLHGLKNIMMISPRTDKNRIMEIDRLSEGFIYMVSSSSITGIKKGFAKEQTEYFDRVKKMKLINPVLIGFGVSDRKTFNLVCHYACGGIIGSAFIKTLDERNLRKASIRNFIKEIRGT